VAKKQSTGDMREKIKRIVASWHPQCVGLEGGTLSKARERLKARYLGYGFGNDESIREQGWSTAISRDVFEVVEWAKPGLLRVFSSGDEIVRFESANQQDEQMAQDATDYVNALFARNSFDLVHHCLTDGLYQRVGWAKAWYDKREEPIIDEYEGLSEEEAVSLLSSTRPEAKVEVKARPADEEQPDGAKVVDITIRDKKVIREVKIETIPSENVIVAQDAKNPETARFIAHWEDRMASELVKEGYSQELVDGLPRVSTSHNTDYPERNLSSEQNYEGGSNSANTGDDSTDLIRVYEGYTFADVNNDGIAERIKVTYAGDGVTPEVLDWEEWPHNRPPLFSACSVPLPHTVVGLCVADGVVDIEQQSSELLRYLYDNLYLSNQGELHVNKGSDGRIDFDQLLSRRAGGIIESEGTVTITPLPVAAGSGETALAALAMLGKVKENRTGIGQNLMGVQADELQNTATGASIQEEAINQRLEMIARIYAETFFKPLAKYVLCLLKKYQDKASQIALKGRLMDLNPRQWDADWNVQATVGLGTGNRVKQSQALQQILTIQQQMATALGPKVSPVKLHHIVYSCHRLAQGMGFQSPEQFFGTIEDAQKAEQIMATQPPPPNPDMMKVQIEQQKAQNHMNIKQFEAQQKAQLAGQEAAAKVQIARQEVAANYQLKTQELGAEADLKQTELAMRHIGQGLPQIQEQHIGGTDGL
jgi:hypothetical protein